MGDELDCDYLKEVCTDQANLQETRYFCIGSRLFAMLKGESHVVWRIHPGNNGEYNTDVNVKLV